MKKLILPYAFKGVSSTLLDQCFIGKQVQQARGQVYFGDGIYTSFSKIYTDVLSAIAEDDKDYLNQIMEKQLYLKTISGIEEIKKKNLKIHYLEDSRANYEEIQESVQDQITEIHSNKTISPEIFKDAIMNGSLYKEIDMKIILKAHGIFGPRINREENKNKLFQIDGTMSQRSYYLDFSNLMSLYNNQILVLNVFFQTSRRLYTSDEDGDIINGEDNLKKQSTHVWRFETYTPNYDWVLTDMDYFLEGNPYSLKSIQSKNTNTNSNA